MSGKGKPPNGNGAEDELGPLFPGVDFDPSELGNLYVSYEQLIAAWTWACMEAKLRLYSVTNTLDINTLEREFSACCVPMEWDPPYQLRAEISFYWPAEYTTLSLDGDEAFCSLYHDEHEPCDHETGSAQVFIELELEYHLPYDFVHRLDSDAGIEKVAQRIQEAFSAEAEHENVVTVQAVATYADNQLSLTGIQARHVWILEDELHGLPQLAGSALEICQEIRRVLLRFAREFSAGKEPPSS